MGTHHKGSKHERLCLDAFIKLMRAAGAIESLNVQSLTTKKLTISQFGVLEALFHLGPLCQRDLSEKILRSTSNLTSVLDKLEERDLVRRERSTEDRRYVTIHLSVRGRKVIAAILPEHLDLIVRRMSALGDRDLATLNDLLKRLGTASGVGKDRP